jgi:hypothetical protein
VTVLAKGGQLSDVEDRTRAAATAVAARSWPASDRMTGPVFSYRGPAA